MLSTHEISVPLAAILSSEIKHQTSNIKHESGLVMPENIASVRVLEKTGLRYVETVSLWGKQFSKYLALPPIS